MDPNLLDRMLDTYQTERTVVTVTLQNRTRVRGRIRSFDSYIIMMENQKGDIIFRHAVSSLNTGDLSGIPQQARPKPAVHAAQGRPPRKPAGARTRTERPRHDTRQRDDEGFNDTMKDGLLKWIQGRGSGK